MRIGTGLYSSYTIKRERDGSYSIPLVLNFHPTEDYNGPVPQDKVPEYYMNKVQKCMDQANQKMLGPNGEKLNINIQAPTRQNKDDCNRENAIQIAIGPLGIRGHAKKYEPNFDCPTITHEVLHLLGLCDEYMETAIGFYVNSETGKVKSRTLDNMAENKKLMSDKSYEFKPDYNCRIIQDNSIMSFHQERWMNVYDLKTDESLLDPGHFNSVLYGDCDINKSFNDCSQLAYENSFIKKNCIEKKHECESQNILGRNKQEEIELIQAEIDRNYKVADAVKKMIEYLKKPPNNENTVDPPLDINMGGGMGKGSGMNISGGMGFGIAVGGNTGTYGNNPEAFLSQKLDDINKQIDSLKERSRRVESWPDP